MTDKNDWSYYLGWYCAFGIVGGLLFAAVWSASSDLFCVASKPVWLPWSGQEDHCFREWLSATSGWVGFVAAAIGAFFVFHQLREQQRQTAFLLGDSPPTFDVVQKEDDLAKAEIIVTNWNRRMLAVRAIEVISEAGPVMVSGWDGGGKIIGPGTAVCSLNPAWPVKGWLNRSGPPADEVGVVVLAPGGTVPIIPWEHLRFRFTYALSGMTHEQTAEAPVHRPRLTIQVAASMTLPGFSASAHLAQRQPQSQTASEQDS